MKKKRNYIPSDTNTGIVKYIIAKVNPGIELAPLPKQLTNVTE